MVLIDQMWDEVVAGPQPQRGLGLLRKVATTKGSSSTIPDLEGDQKYKRTLSMPGTPPTPGTPTTPSPTSQNHNVWRSVFNPGSNLATRGLGGQLFDKPNPDGSSPTVYDWLYSGDTRSKHR